MIADNIAVGDDAAWIVTSIIKHVYDIRFQKRKAECCLVKYNPDISPHYTFMFGEIRMTMNCLRLADGLVYALFGQGWSLKINATEGKIEAANGSLDLMKIELLAMKLWEPSS
jgi:hypothetical protein